MKKLINELEPYKFPRGAYSMYIRQCFDQLIYDFQRKSQKIIYG